MGLPPVTCTCNSSPRHEDTELDQDPTNRQQTEAELLGQAGLTATLALCRQHLPSETDPIHLARLEAVEQHFRVMLWEHSLQLQLKEEAAAEPASGDGEYRVCGECVQFKPIPGRGDLGRCLMRLFNTAPAGLECWLWERW